MFNQNSTITMVFQSGGNNNSWSKQRYDDVLIEAMKKYIIILFLRYDTRNNVDVGSQWY